MDKTLFFHFAQLGYSVQGNEVSHYALLSSNFIWNTITEENQYEIYPYLHSFSNLKQEKDAFNLYNCIFSENANKSLNL